MLLTRDDARSKVVLPGYHPGCYPQKSMVSCFDVPAGNAAV